MLTSVETMHYPPLGNRGLLQLETKYIGVNAHKGKREQNPDEFITMFRENPQNRISVNINI